MKRFSLTVTIEKENSAQVIENSHFKVALSADGKDKRRKVRSFEKPPMSCIPFSDG